MVNGLAVVNLRIFFNNTKLGDIFGNSTEYFIFNTLLELLSLSNTIDNKKRFEKFYLDYPLFAPPIAISILT